MIEQKENPTYEASYYFFQSNVQETKITGLQK